MTVAACKLASISIPSERSVALATVAIHMSANPGAINKRSPSDFRRPGRSEDTGCPATV